MAIDKKILKAAVANLRKGLRTHGGRSLMPELPPRVPAGSTRKDDEEEEEVIIPKGKR